MAKLPSFQRLWLHQSGSRSLRYWLLFWRIYMIKHATRGVKEEPIWSDRASLVQIGVRERPWALFSSCLDWQFSLWRQAVSLWREAVLAPGFSRALFGLPPSTFPVFPRPFSGTFLPPWSGCA